MTDRYDAPEDAEAMAQYRDYRAGRPLDREQACCAHLTVSWRTERVPYDGPVLYDASGKYPPLKLGTMVARGWWECDYGCGAKFMVVPQSGVPTMGNCDAHGGLHMPMDSCQNFVVRDRDGAA
jgi:hypothetical protein